MKKLLQFLFSGITILVVFCTIASAQTPQTFNYQAIARDNTGDPIINTAVSVRVAILRGSPPGFLLWEEQHSVTTNGFGLFTISVGDPAASKSGGSLSSFSEIWWHSGPLSIRPSIEYQSTWHQLEESPLASVPYALYAKKVEEGQFPVNGDTIYLPTGSLSIGSDQAGGSKLAVVSSDDSSGDPLFEVKRADGQTVFAVYSDAVRAYVAPVIESKGRARGGFSVGGFDRTKATLTDDLFWITPDSIRFYINDDQNASPGTKGGFSVNGFNKPGNASEFLRVTDDSTRIYIRNPEGKGARGGFAVGGFDRTKGEVTNFLNLTPDNYFIGHRSGLNTTGLYNSFLGFETGVNNSSGSNNVFLGYRSGNSNTSAFNNVFIGTNSGYSNTIGFNNTFVGNTSGYNNLQGSHNLFLGYNSGNKNTSGSYNTFLGSGTGYNNLSGNYNTFVGYNSGDRNNSGSSNTFMGHQSGWYNEGGDYNSFIGYQSGLENLTGTRNVFIGMQSGLKNNDGNYNAFLGFQSGYYNKDVDHNVFIGYQAGFYNTYQQTLIADDGAKNTFIGYRAGYQNRIGAHNVYIGNEAGLSNTTGDRNTFLGKGAGIANTTGSTNIFVGSSSGTSNQDGYGNVYIGNSSANNSISGVNNVYIGTNAGYLSFGSQNIILGAHWDMTLNQMGNYNIFLGNQAGQNEAGSNKLYIENSATDKTGALIYGDFASNLLRFNGRISVNSDASGARDHFTIGSNDTQITGFRIKNSTVTDNVLLQVVGSGVSGREGNFEIWSTGGNSFTIDPTRNIGFGTTNPQADIHVLRPDNDFSSLYLTGSSQGAGLLFLGQSTSYGGGISYDGDNAPDIIGNNDRITFFRRYAGIDYEVMSYGHNNPDVTHAARVFATAFIVSSDQRLKKNVVEIDGSLEKVLSIRGVKFDWLNDQNDTSEETNVSNLGFIAQEVEKVIPEVVSTDHRGYKSVSYGNLTAILVEALKDQQKIIDEKETRMIELELENNDIKSRLETLESIVEALMQK